uniref:RING-type E3 ubiquitin transferase n=1 Tax=Phaeodactylum tricornutum TaxID=2850 RepID=A0A8J9TSD6_PHATR
MSTSPLVSVRSAEEMVAGSPLSKMNSLQNDADSSSIASTPNGSFKDANVTCLPSLENEGLDDSQLDREEQESLELARMLMAEEAMAVYENSFQLLRESADQLSQEDYQAMQELLREEEREQVAELEDDEGELSYETMLEIGERIGDVKTERWTLDAQRHIHKLPTVVYRSSNVGADVDDSESKCLVCQSEYEEEERLRRLPCGHSFHASCVDQWLNTKDVCPYCRTCIVDERTQR